MTEAEWERCRDPEAMLSHLGRKGSDRKRRLFVVTCLRQIAPEVPRIAAALGTVEAFADGRVTRKDLEGAARDARRMQRELSDGKLTGVGAGFLCRVEEAAWASPSEAVRRVSTIADPHLIRCVFGNRFRPVAFDPAQLIPDAVSLAAAAYEGRVLPCGELDRQRLAVLSDALEEAGCTDADILSHLRSPGPHVRGCWALDLILGKS